LGYGPWVGAGIVVRLRARAEEAIREKRPALAIASLNPLLALDPSHPRGTELLAKLGRRRRKRRVLRRALTAALAVGVVACAAVGGQRLWSAHRAATKRAALSKPVPVGARPPHSSQARSTGADRQPGSAQAAPSPAPPSGGSPPRTAQAPSPAAVGGEPARASVASARRERPSRKVASAPRPAGLKARVLIRPYGFIRVDGGPLSAQALAQHVLSLAPGRHKVQITCRFCEPTEETITVRPGQENVFRLPAELKPSHLAFDYQPKDAQVTVEDLPPRSVAQSVLTPFEVRSAKGPASFQHSVTYEIRREGYATEHKTVLIPAGQTVVLHGKLAPR
jgi:serine/threonine-protein kinase